MRQRRGAVADCFFMFQIMRVLSTLEAVQVRLPDCQVLKMYICMRLVCSMRVLTS